MNIPALRRLAPVPLVVVGACRDQHPWWVLSSSSCDWGWIDGQLVPDKVQLYSDWISHLLSNPGIDEDWLSLLGFSAGAYAITELVALHGAGKAPVLKPKNLVLGGVHGHGQPDLEGLDDRHRAKLPLIRTNWQAYLARLSRHSGVPGGIFGVHCRMDNVCPWTAAEKIFETLGKRQRQLGLSEVDVDEVEISEAKKKKSKYAHSYNDRTFCRAELLDRLLPASLSPRRRLKGGPPPKAARGVPKLSGFPPPKGGFPPAKAPPTLHRDHSAARSRSPRLGVKAR